jgi:hypothetical protein
MYVRSKLVAALELAVYDAETAARKRTIPRPPWWYLLLTLLAVGAKVATLIISALADDSAVWQGALRDLILLLLALAFGVALSVRRRRRQALFAALRARRIVDEYRVSQRDSFIGVCTVCAYVCALFSCVFADDWMAQRIPSVALVACKRGARWYPLAALCDYV